LLEKTDRLQRLELVTTGRLSLIVTFEQITIDLHTFTNGEVENF